MNISKIASAVAFTLWAGAAHAAAGDADAAKTLLNEFVKKGADHAALTKKLRPQAADYKAVFTGEMAKTAEAQYKPAWDSGSLVIRPKEEQTELKVWAATADELKTNAGDAKEFPGGYKGIAPHLQKGVTFYRFKFVKAGETMGMAYDGLVFVNGHFVFVPKPFRLIASNPEKSQE